MTLKHISTLVLSVVFAEFCGYVLHILLHSEGIAWLSRSHMQHHLREYHPSKPIRLVGVYLSSGSTRFNILGLGLEWLVPVAVLLAVVLGVSRLLGVAAATQKVFLAGATGWSWFLFGYMHDQMHLKNNWLERTPLLRRWYAGVRRNHDIHHFTFTEDGRLLKNFGICFFWYDRLFGTLRTFQEKLNRPGLRAAERRYAYITSV